jgi:AcrR family transcriptional regulator
MPVTRARRKRRRGQNARGAASRERILGCAVELLRERGYAGLSIAAICERAEIAPTSVYWHFGDKAGLMEAVLDRIGGRHAERILAAATSARTPREKLERTLAGMRELVLTQPLGSLTGVAVVGEGRHVAPDLRTALRRARDREREAIARSLRTQEQPIARHAEALAVIATAVTNYAALCYRMDRDPDEVDRVLGSLRALLGLVEAA